MDAEQICTELDRVRDDYRDLLDTATVAELRRPTDGTRWSNEQVPEEHVEEQLLVAPLRAVRGVAKVGNCGGVEEFSVVVANTIHLRPDLFLIHVLRLGPGAAKRIRSSEWAARTAARECVSQVAACTT